MFNPWDLKFSQQNNTFDANGQPMQYDQFGKQIGTGAAIAYSPNAPYGWKWTPNGSVPVTAEEAQAANMAPVTPPPAPMNGPGAGTGQVSQETGMLGGLGLGMGAGGPPPVDMQQSQSNFLPNPNLGMPQSLGMNKGLFGGGNAIPMPKGGLPTSTATMGFGNRLPNMSLGLPQSRQQPQNRPGMMGGNSQQLMMLLRLLMGRR